MKRNIFTLFMMGLILLLSSPAFTQSYSFSAEKHAYMLNGDFLTDPDLVNPTVGVDRNATMDTIMSADPDSVYFGAEALHVVFTDDAEGKDRLEFKLGAEADMSFFNAGILTFWVKLNDTIDFNFEVNAERNDDAEVKGSDASMADYYGLDLGNDSTWQMITINLALDVKGDRFNYRMFESFGFRSRGNPADFFLDEMHVVYYGAYGMYTERVGWMSDGDFLTDPTLVDAKFQADNFATVREITNGDPDSVLFGQNSIYVNLTDDAEGKDRLEFKVAEDADLSQFNSGTLVFYIKLLSSPIDINFEVSANRDGAMEAKGSDASMKENYGLDTSAVDLWQKIMIDLTEPVAGDNFTFDIFESFSFRSRGNASEFIIDEMHVILSGGYGMYADKAGFKVDGDFLTDPDLVGAQISADRQATVREINDPDSAYFGNNAIYANLTDDADGKDRLELKVAEEADMSFFSNGTLIFWIKLLVPTVDINFEFNANRNNAGEAKGTDVSMKDTYGLDVNNDSTWQKIMINLADPVEGDNFSYDIFEGFGFRSRENASEFIVDEMHVLISSPLARYLSDVATLDTLVVSTGSLDPGFTSETLTYDLVAPAGTDSVTVTATATDSNATVEGTGTYDVASGDTTVTITVTAEDGKTKLQYKVNITRDATYVEDELLPGIKVYPNPAASTLVVELGDNEVKDVDLVNLLGQTVISKRVQSNRVLFNVGDLSNGIYVVSLDGIPHAKIVVQK